LNAKVSRYADHADGDPGRGGRRPRPKKKERSFGDGEPEAAPAAEPASEPTAPPAAPLEPPAA
jgi:hypothetical protein